MKNTFIIITLLFLPLFVFSQKKRKSYNSFLENYELNYIQRFKKEYGKVMNRLFNDIKLRMSVVNSDASELLLFHLDCEICDSPDESIVVITKDTIIMSTAYFYTKNVRSIQINRSPFFNYLKSQLENNEFNFCSFKNFVKKDKEEYCCNTTIFHYKKADSVLEVNQLYAPLFYRGIYSDRNFGF